MACDEFKCDLCGYRKLYYTSNKLPDMMNVVTGICPECKLGNMVLDVDNELNFKRELHEEGV